MARRCLLVDDSTAFLASAAALLESQGMRVVGRAESADQAIEMVDKLKPELALIDVELGADDGVALAGRLAQRQPPLAVVLISAYALRDDSDLTAGSGAAGFLAKRTLSVAAIDELLSGVEEG